MTNWRDFGWLRQIGKKSLMPSIALNHCSRTMLIWLGAYIHQDGG